MDKKEGYGTFHFVDGDMFQVRSNFYVVRRFLEITLFLTNVLQSVILL